MNTNHGIRIFESNIGDGIMEAVFQRSFPDLLTFKNGLINDEQLSGNSIKSNGHLGLEFAALFIKESFIFGKSEIKWYPQQLLQLTECLNICSLSFH